MGFLILVEVIYVFRLVKWTENNWQMFKTWSGFSSERKRYWISDSQWKQPDWNANENRSAI